MVKQYIFALALLLTLGIFGYTISRLIKFFSFTQKGFPVKHIGKRLIITLKVALGQTKIFRMPVIGLIHALVFWGFCVILIGSIEMVIDGISGSDRALAVMGTLYDVISASGDIFALIVGISIVIFLFRRLFLHVKRFHGIEMKEISHKDANLALSMILLLMVSLLGMNVFYVAYKQASGEVIAGIFPVSGLIAPVFQGLTLGTLHTLHEVFWWLHILLIFAFANILPYSKHFHVFMSVPNVFLSRLEPLGKLMNMESVMNEVRLMMNPDTAFSAPVSETAPARFGVKDVDDLVWKSYFDSLSCTECGRCTSVCPANITGKRLSPRKIIMDIRARMKEKGPLLSKNGKGFDDGRSLLRSYITEEELWACTTCNACAQECPVNINHPSVIVDMRRFLVMEEASAPGELKGVFNNIENNGAPWQYSCEDRMLWAKDIELKLH